MTNQVGAAAITGDSPRRWDVLAGFMLSQGYREFVEVGCKEGRTTGHILAAVPEARAWAIDPWCAQPGAAVAGRETYENWDFQKIEAEFWRNVGEHRARCHMLQLTSEEAARALADDPVGIRGRGFDLVFIDALHDYESVRADIARFWPLVREGGMLCGHDFNHKWPGVERAVAEAFCLIDVGVTFDSTWFVLKTPGMELWHGN